MKITIHRGTHQIGGCITGITADSGARVIIDVGAELPGAKGGKNSSANIANITKRANAVFITHYHGDHIGEYINIDKDTPVYMGKAAKDIFLIWQKRLANLPGSGVSKDNIERIEKFIAFDDQKAIEIEKDGEIMKITPIRTDHSAFDSYMFLIDADNQRILHTGDFRTHGLTGADIFPNLHKYTEDVNALICENTMLSRPGEEPKTEDDLGKDANALMAAPENKYTFVLCSSLNIDALATFYNAALANDKMFIVLEEGFQLEILKTVKEFSDGNGAYAFDESRIKAYLDENRKPDKQLLQEMEKKGFCMIVGANNTSQGLIAKKQFKDHLLIYSLWSGYLDPRFAQIKPYKKYSEFVNLSKKLSGRQHVPIHTSGHASKSAIKDVLEITKPKAIIPIHGENPENFRKLNVSADKIVILRDREVYDVTTGKIDEFTKAERATRLNYVSEAKRVWEDYKDTDVRKWFHLRPFSSGIMVICTIPPDKCHGKKYPMTGVKCTISGKTTKLRDKLNKINMDIRTPGDIEEKLNRLGFGERSDTKKSNEHIFQCNFINMLVNGGDKRGSFEKMIGSGSLNFVASEFVIHKGDSKKDIVDVVAYCEDTKTLHMFELKVGKPYAGLDVLKEQVNGYIWKYGISGRRIDDMREILAIYPNTSVTEINNVAFYSIIAESEDDIGITNVANLKWEKC